MAQLKLWIDDLSRPDESYYWIRSVDEAKEYIESYMHGKHFMETHENAKDVMEVYDSILIDIDNYAGKYIRSGGDYIKLLNWLEYMGIVDDSFSFHIHSMNSVKASNMKAIIERNGWKYIQIEEKKHIYIKYKIDSVEITRDTIIELYTDHYDIDGYIDDAKRVIADKWKVQEDDIIIIDYKYFGTELEFFVLYEE